jgi:aspartate racemase
MKRIGIIGGLGPEATVDYYKEIINAFKDSGTALNYPEILIYSVNMSEFIGLMNDNNYSKAATLLLEKINALKKAGADFAAISANTPHLMFNEISKQSPLPLVSIVEATCAGFLRKGLKRPGLIGTGFTMNATFYQDVFKRHNIEVLVPDKDDREVINYKLFTEIELGIFKDETRQLLIDLISKMVQNQSIDSLILGCTEFPLILTEGSYAGIPMLNTTKIHVDAIVKYCLLDDNN